MFNRIKQYRQLGLWALLVLWGGALAMGGVALWRYAATPGSSGEAMRHWPENAPIQPEPGRATLVMFAHPKCPCTRASLGEFAKLLDDGKVNGWVVFLRPDGASPGWEKTDLWEKAGALPGVRTMVDTDGSIAKLFGAQTSGYVVFYDASQTLRYHGGVTSARGESGASVGGQTIASVLQGQSSPQDQAATFGCPLQSKEARP